MTQMDRDYRAVAAEWLAEPFDAETRKEVFDLFQSGDEKELEDRFYRTLEFGTGGLRGLLGAGTNRMNRYTVSMATQGLANYLQRQFPEGASVVISYDSRHCSAEFALIAAKVLLSNGIRAYIFDNIRPTPELSFAIRHLHCQAGIMVTASHNPKEYNGYKVFWADGAQITPPHDKNIIAEVSGIASPADVRLDESLRPEGIGAEVDEAYLSAILSLMMSPDSVARHTGLKMVYTPLHGTGVRLIPAALKRLGFTQVYNVPEQDLSDGDFPTVASPNPEEKAAMALALARAEEVGADLVMASDPDADRVGAAVRDDSGALVQLNGNQTASILTAYLLDRWKAAGRLSDKTYCVKTIVTTGLIADICRHYGVRCFEVLTGFKYIAEVVREQEGKGTFVCGGEESYGFNAGEFVRDKDAVVTCSLLAECAAWLADQGKTLWSYLQEIYAAYGFYRESLRSVTIKGKEGVAAIQALMAGYRAAPPAEIGGEKVVRVVDYLEPEKTGLPKSNVLQFFTASGVVSVRPSGTEPKIKYYYGVRGASASEADARLSALEAFGA